MESKLTVQIEILQGYIFRNAYKLIGKVKITILKNVTNLFPIFHAIRSKLLKLFKHINRSRAEFSKLSGKVRCLENDIKENQNRSRIENDIIL